MNLQACSVAHEQLRELSDDSLIAIKDVGGVAGDLVRLAEIVQGRLRDRWYDTRDLLDQAATMISRLGHVVLYLPQWLRPAEVSFVRHLDGANQVTAVVGLTGVARADHAVIGSLARLGVELAAGPKPRVATEVINASDSDDEVRCVVREVVETVKTVPAHRVAVLYGAASPYPRLLHEHLGAAGIMVNGAGIRPTGERAVARMLTEMLALADRDVPRGDLFQAIANVPSRDFDDNRIPLSHWERTSRSAGVLAGDDWTTRIATYIADEKHRIVEEMEGPDPLDSIVERSRSQIEAAESLGRFANRLRDELRTAAALTSWRELGDWCYRLFDTVLGVGDELLRLPPEEQHSAAAVTTLLAGVASLDSVGTPASLDGLRQLLNLELSSSVPRVGRFGEGVFVAHLSQAVGLDLDVVFLVGLAEDIYPGRRGEDALLPDRVRTVTNGELPLTRERIDAKHRHLLAAFTSAPRVVAAFPRGDLRRSTKRLPSRFLLPTLRALANDGSLAATRWESATYTHMHTSGSFAGELLTAVTLGTEQEWRTRTAKFRGELADDAVAAAVSMMQARDSTGLTRFDGNLAGGTGLPNYLIDDAAVSPTALEAYATCPHAFFVQRLLGVEPVEQPEDVIEISPADIGNLVHQSMAELIEDLADELPGCGEPWTHNQRAKLIGIAERLGVVFTQRGLTGHPRLWAPERHRVLTDLTWMLDDDDHWHALNDARIAASEMPFGIKGQPPVEILVPGGRILMRGSADKVDISRSGTIFVTDIKSGSQRAFKDITKDDPTVGGTKLQLPVYAHAARERYGDRGTEVRAEYWFVRRDRGRIELELTPDLEASYARILAVLARSIATGLFPPKAPDKPDFAWVQCHYCNPDGVSHAENRARWERKRNDPALAELVGLVDAEALKGNTTEVDE
jgi:ATP-dependent helicase/nuclease subunit B